MGIIQKQDNRGQDSHLKSETQNPKSVRTAFTLTELLVVITIIAILAGLTTGAVVRAMKRAKQAQITLELQNIGGAVEDFKTEFGAYPPNAMIKNSGVANYLAQDDFVRMFSKAFPRSREPRELIRALAGVAPSGSVRSSGLTGEGMNGAEALYFWLGGFSKDTSYPISGPGGPSFRVDSSQAGNGEILEDRQRPYEFDLGRLLPRDNDMFSGRFIEYVDPLDTNQTRRINFWYYVPAGSTIPMAYFDTSRHSPEKYDLPMWNGVYAIKQARQGIAAPTANSDIRFVEDKKFQILHAGIDDIWGDQFRNFRLNVEDNGNNAYTEANILLAPEGPFIGDIADTLANFMGGPLEEKQE